MENFKWKENVIIFIISLIISTILFNMNYTLDLIKNIVILIYNFLFNINISYFKYFFVFIFTFFILKIIYLFYKKIQVYNEEEKEKIQQLNEKGKIELYKQISDYYFKGISLLSINLAIVGYTINNTINNFYFFILILILVSIATYLAFNNIIRSYFLLKINILNNSEYKK